MANKKPQSKRKTKKVEINTHILIACVLAVATLFVAIFAINYKQENDSPKYEKVDSEKNVDKNSVTANKNEVSNTDENPNESTSPTESETEPPSEPTSQPPVKNGSFYDGVNYRSPYAKTANIFKHGRNLMLLNNYYELPEDFKWDLVYWENGQYVDALALNYEQYNSVKAVDRAAYEPLKNMFAAASEAGVPLQLVSAYRSIHLQDKLFTRSVNSYLSQGYSLDEAKQKANYARTYTGTSEHNTGLGFDILQKGNFTLSTSFENTAQFKWLMENAEDYGFILRYQKDKTDITGIMYEPWHFRYVGVEHAKKINELGMCLEEYIEHLDNQG